MRALVVEDNQELAENVAELLEDLDVTSRCVDNVEAALEAAKDGFELAIVDIGLPGGSGVALIPELKQRAPDAEIVLMTGDGTIETAIEAVRLGAFAYVLKPFDPSGLLQLVEKALTQIRLRRERTELSRALRESEALYRGIVETAEALVVGVDHDGKIVFANQLAAGEDDLRERSFVEVWGAGDVVFAKRVQTALLGGVAKPYEATIPQRAEKRTIRWSFARVEDVGGRRIAVLAMGLDVTEQILLRRRSARAEALAAIGTLTAGLAHEVRNPLNAAMLQLQLLERSAKKLGPDAAEPIAERVKIVRGELGRLTQMLDDFLRLARPEEVRRDRVDLCALIQEIGQLEGPVCESCGIALAVRCEGALAFEGDAHRIKQVLVNLVRNAREALRQDGRIELCAELDGGQLVIEVRDDGPGFGDAADQIFEPFFTTKAAGTGLGMSIVKKIIEMHGGEVSLSTLLGGGACVRITLPASPKAAIP
ncbi:MAG: ATP-binding protein [Myxococcota bacterium]